MFDNREKIKNEMFYSILLLVVTEVFNYFVLKVPFKYLLVIGILGIVVLELWIIRTFKLYSQKKVSKYSDVVMKISLKRRSFQYFVLPFLFYVSLLFFLYFNRNAILGHLVLIISIVFILVACVNMKNSLQRHYSIALATRTIYDFICITALYLLLNSYLRIGFSLEEFILLSFFSSFLLLLSILRLHDRLGPIEALVAIVSSLLVCGSMYVVWNSNVFVIPCVGALTFYLIASFWNLRFAGRTKLSDYLYPVVYVSLALVIILFV